MKQFLFFQIIFFISGAFIYPQKIALTFDDAPIKDGAFFSGMQRTELLIKKLDSLKINQAAFFCITNRFDSTGLKRIKMYDEAGHIIANHTHSHSRYTNIGIDNYINEIMISDSILKSFSNFRRWFRFPFLDEGRTIEDRDKLKKALVKNNYLNAYVTVDNYDWYIDNIFRKKLNENKNVDFEKLKEFYISHIYNSIIFYDKISRETLGRSVNHVLLLHENDLAALFIGHLVDFLRKKGWQIISPDEAYKDEIALIIPDVLFNNQGRVAAIAYSSGKKGRELVQESEDEEFLEKEIERLGIFK